MIECAVAYNALTSRDPQFDGVFFVGVTLQCTVTTPK